MRFFESQSRVFAEKAYHSQRRFTVPSPVFQGFWAATRHSPFDRYLTVRKTRHPLFQKRQNASRRNAQQRFSSAGCLGDVRKCGAAGCDHPLKRYVVIKFGARGSSNRSGSRRGSRSGTGSLPRSPRGLRARCLIEIATTRAFLPTA